MAEFVILKPFIGLTISICIFVISLTIFVAILLYRVILIHDYASDLIRNAKNSLKRERIPSTSLVESPHEEERNEQPASVRHIVSENQDYYLSLFDGFTDQHYVEGEDPLYTRMEGTASVEGTNVSVAGTCGDEHVSCPYIEINELTFPENIRDSNRRKPEESHYQEIREVFNAF